MKIYEISVSGYAKHGRLEITNGGNFVFNKEISVASESIPWGNKVVTGIDLLSLTDKVIAFRFRLSQGRVSDRIWFNCSIASDKPYVFLNCEFSLTHQFAIKSSVDQRDITVDTKSVALFLESKEIVESKNLRLSPEEASLLFSPQQSAPTSLDATLLVSAER